MRNSNSGLKRDSIHPRSNIIDKIVFVVHHKVFPATVTLIFVILVCSMWLIGQGSFFIKLALIACSIPGFIAFALYMYGLSDSAPNLHEFYKRFKQEFAPNKNND